jgi:hypothetical protein
MKGDGDECCRRDGDDGRDVEAEIAGVPVRRASTTAAGSIRHGTGKGSWHGDDRGHGRLIGGLTGCFLTMEPVIDR